MEAKKAAKEGGQMSLESAMRVLVAVAVPAWLVVEQFMKWQILKNRRTSPVRVDNSTGPALRRKAA